MYFEKHKEKLRCLVCPNECLLSKGERGFCYLRMNTGREILPSPYGGLVSICLDPIEKKPLRHFLTNTKTLSLGTIGCNLACIYCQNWQISTSQDESLMQVHNAHEIVSIATRENIPSISYTYNEPSINLEFYNEISALAHKEGIKTIAVSSGNIKGKAREDFFSKIDAANIDLKSINPEFYIKYCKGNLETILETLKFIRSQNIHLEITNLVIPGLNDSDQEIKELIEWIITELGANTPTHFSAFFPHHKLVNIGPTPPDTLFNIKEIAGDMGLTNIYLGNI